MLLRKILIVAAVALAPVPALAQELPDLGRWTEVTLPGAPFRVDIPMPLTPKADRVIGTTTIKGWETDYGLMSIELGFTDRTVPTSFSARDNLEQLAGGLIQEWKTPTANLVANVSDLTVAGHTAAKMEIERTLDSGRRIRTERLLVRVGDDDWTVQTTRFVGQGDDLDSAHIFESVQAPTPGPTLTEAAVGRMTIKGFGQPTVTVDQLEGDAAASYDKWVTHAFDYQGTTKAWIYNIRVKPGNVFDAAAAAQMLIDNVVQQSDPQPSVYPFPMEVGALEGTFARGQANTGQGEECFRILAVADGPEGWAMLLAGPNTARSETMFREMIDSIRIAPE
jgi:hypothetical protein